MLLTRRIFRRVVWLRARVRFWFWLRVFLWSLRFASRSMPAISKSWSGVLKLLLGRKHGAILPNHCRFVERYCGEGVLLDSPASQSLLALLWAPTRSPTLAPSFESHPYTHNNKKRIAGRHSFLSLRRGWDSNPRSSFTRTTH